MITEFKLWLVSKLLDDSWALVDRDYGDQVLGTLTRLKSTLGTAYQSRLEADQVAQARYHTRQLELALGKITHGTTPRRQSATDEV